MPNLEPNSDSAQPDSQGIGRGIRAALERELGSGLVSPASSPSIADHTLLHRIGNGAYGEVWLARNALGTLRAVKIVYRARFEDDRPYEREFHGILKYEPISRTHEGLVQVLHVGRNDDAGCFYYVMELADCAPEPYPDQASGAHPGRSQMVADGRITTAELAPTGSNSYSPHTLGTDLRQHRCLPAQQSAELTGRLACALVHLHAHGLVHRDIKPTNVIFVGGLPKLADIGLVAGAGASYSFVGTEGFVPPEGPGQPQGDIYALGKLLYELATGFDRLEFPKLPPGLPRDPEREALLELNEVITRACAPRPEHRYASAAELRIDLQLFVAGRSLRAARKTERHLTWMKPLTLAACACLMAAAMVVWLSKRAEREAYRREKQSREQAQTEAALRGRAEAAERDAQAQLHLSLFEQARATLRSGELGHRIRAQEALHRAAAISNSLELSREAIAAMTLPDVRIEREWSGGSDVTAVILDAAFKRMAVSRGPAPIEIRSAADFSLVATLPSSGSGSSYWSSWSPDGQYLAVKRDLDPAGEWANIEVWNVAEGKQAALLKNVRRGAISFDRSRPRLFAATGGSEISALDLDRFESLHILGTAGPIEILQSSPDGKRLAVCYPERGRWTIAIQDAEHGSILYSCRFGARITNLDWHPGGQWIAAGDYDGTVHLLDSGTGVASALGRHKSTAFTVAFSPDGQFLVSGGWERELFCWDLRTGQQSFTMALNSFNFLFGADGHECAMVGDGRVRMGVFEMPTAHRDLGNTLGRRVHHAAFSPDGRWFAASGEKCLGLWNLATAASPALVNEAAEARPYFTPDSTELFGSRGLDNCFRWQIESDPNQTSALRRLKLTKPAGFTSLCLASNRIVWTTRAGTQVSESQSAAAEKPWAESIDGINLASPDGRWVGIFRPFTSVLYVYRVADIECVAKLTNQTSIYTFSFDPLGNEIAVCSRNQVEFWSVKTWQRTRTLTNFMHILFAPDGRHAWLTRELRHAGLYDWRTLEPKLLLPTGMLPLAASGDGRRLGVTIEERRVQIWDLAELEARLRELGLDPAGVKATPGLP